MVFTAITYSAALIKPQYDSQGKLKAVHVSQQVTAAAGGEVGWWFPDTTMASTLWSYLKGHTWRITRMTFFATVLTGPRTIQPRIFWDGVTAAYLDRIVIPADDDAVSVENVNAVFTTPQIVYPLYFLQVITSALVITEAFITDVDIEVIN